MGYGPVDCSNFNINDCEEDPITGNPLCGTCPVTVVPLECNGQPFEDPFEWAACLKEGLAENLGVIKYHFYNDLLVRLILYM